MLYKSLARTSMVFYGVTFNPGDIKDVPGYINHPKFRTVSVDEIKSNEDAKLVAKAHTKKVEAPKKSESAKKLEPANKPEGLTSEPSSDAISTSEAPVASTPDTGKS